MSSYDDDGRPLTPLEIMGFTMTVAVAGFVVVALALGLIELLRRIASVLE